jgi:DNA-binding response OmpR family regulator
VVEYDPQVLCVLRDILVRAGFTVLLARSGEKALQVYQQHRMEVDLLVTDGLPLSGFAGAESASGLPMLNKPFTPAALVEAVRALLGRPQPRPIRPKRANA